MINSEHGKVRNAEFHIWESIKAGPELQRIYLLFHGFNRLFSRRVGVYDFGRITLKTDGLILMRLSVAELYHMNNITDKMLRENFRSDWGLFRKSRVFNLRVHIPIDIPFKEGTELLLGYNPGQRLKDTIEPKMRLILTKKTDNEYSKIRKTD